MKNKFLLLILLLSYGISYAQEDCSKFKIGNFRNIENGILKEKIRRNDSIQIERYKGKIVRLKIVWIDECSYKLIFMDGNETFWNSRPKGMPTHDLIVRITSVDGNIYTQETRIDNMDDFVYKSEMMKIE